MSARISRRKLAEYAVEQLQSGVSHTDLTKELAAYLIDTGRERELDLLVRTIEDQLEATGLVVATVTTARPLSEVLRRDIRAKIGGQQVELREQVAPEVIGGVMIQTPTRRLDQTLASNINALYRAKL